MDGIFDLEYQAATDILKVFRRGWSFKQQGQDQKELQKERQDRWEKIEEKRRERQKTQILEGQDYYISPAKLNISPGSAGQIESVICQSHLKHIEYLLCAYPPNQVTQFVQNILVSGNLNQSFAIFHQILQQENYTFWKEDLRHTIIHDLFNKIPAQSQMTSISQFILSKLQHLPLSYSSAPMSLTMAPPSIQ